MFFYVKDDLVEWPMSYGLFFLLYLKMSLIFSLPTTDPIVACDHLFLSLVLESHLTQNHSMLASVLTGLGKEEQGK